MSGASAILSTCIGVIIGCFLRRENREKFKLWSLRKTEPWREEQASLDLAWRVFARAHNKAGHRPLCSYDGWEKDLDPMEKVDLYEFPNGDPNAPPDCLEVKHG